MKKYELKKDYPHCLFKVGDIVTLTSDLRFYKKEDTMILKEHVENYPEFWEEVVQKDYEILSIKGKTKSKFIYVLNEEGIYVGKFGTITNFPNGPHKCDIHSVKRLSDGEVFTVGDKVNSTMSHLGLSDLEGPAELVSFTFFCFKEDILYCGLRDSGYYPLSTLLIPKKPLFTTKDGVDIFEGDQVFIINKNYFYFTGNPCHCNSTFKTYKDYLYFSTKEKAEEYILMNKPCLSINDVSVLKNIVSSSWETTLKELVKLKQ